MTGDEGVVQVAARTGATQLGGQRFVGKKSGDHVDVAIVAVVQVLWKDEPKYQIDGYTVRRVEIDCLGESHQCAATRLYAGDSAMRKRDSLVEAGAAQPLSFDELRKDFFMGDVGIRVRQQLAQNLEAVLLAACMHIAKDTARVDKLFQYHER